MSGPESPRHVKYIRGNTATDAFVFSFFVPLPMSSNVNVTHLSTSRINRLLRPLYSKCASLSSIPGSSAPTFVTYASTSRTLFEEQAPPLSILATKATGVRSLLDKAAAETHEASKGVYGVPDCFRN